MCSVGLTRVVFTVPQAFKQRKPRSVRTGRGGFEFRGYPVL